MTNEGGTIDDRRAASSLVTTLSSYVITAALAVLGAQAVLATFVIDRREHLTSFYVVGGFGTAALVGSIIIGGAGVYEIISAGARGDWRITTRGGKFNIQAWLALIGTILVIASAFLGDAKPPQAKAIGVGQSGWGEAAEQRADDASGPTRKFDRCPRFGGSVRRSGPCLS
jgi:hypothetical protein